MSTTTRERKLIASDYYAERGQQLAADYLAGRLERKTVVDLCCANDKVFRRALVVTVNNYDDGRANDDGYLTGEYRETIVSMILGDIESPDGYSKQIKSLRNVFKTSQRLITQKLIANVS